MGQISGPWRYDDSPAARTVGARTFARGGRNFQRTHDNEAELRSADLWRMHRPPDAIANED